MLKVSYKLVVKTFGMSLATWIVMSLIFVDELNQESNAADLGSETEVVVGVNGEMGVKRGRAIELQKSDNISNYRLHELKVRESIDPHVVCSNETHLNLTELHLQTRLIYNMVPKCASLGVRGVIIRLGNKLIQGNYNIGTDYILPFHHKEEDVRKIIDQDLNNKKYRKFKKYVYQKHLHFIDFSLVGSQTPYYINVIRDPVEHHISLYYFQRERGRLKMFSPWHLLINSSSEAIKQRLQMSYDECVYKGDMECSNTEFLFTIIPFFCGQDVHCLIPSQRALATAKRNVIKHFPLVGYVEYLDGFFRLAEVIWPQFFRGASSSYHNGKFAAHKTGARTTEPSAAVKAIMRERLSLEYEFYNWIKQRFHCLYRRYVDSSSVAAL